LRKDILNGSGSSEVLRGVVGCVDEEKGDAGEEPEGKRSTGKRSIDSEKVRGTDSSVVNGVAEIYAVLSGKLGGRGPVNVMSRAPVNRSTTTFSRSSPVLI
jgi:hypothetical protein